MMIDGGDDRVGRATLARASAVELVFEVEMTLRWLAQLPPDELPQEGDVEALRRIIEHRTAEVDRAASAMQAALQAVCNQALLEAERKAGLA